MAELAEVEQTLVSLIAQVAYPIGTAAPSVVDAPVRVYRGWPHPDALETDLSEGIVNISVFPLPAESNVTKYPDEWEELPLQSVNLTLTASGETVTVGGRVGSPLNAMILADNHSFVYPVQATDTLTSIATALSNMISGSTNSGPVITFPGVKHLTARVGQIGGIVREIKRQKKSFRISLWCPTPTIRDQLAAAIDPALADLTFITLPDGTSGRLRYVTSHTDDMPQKSQLWRRDLVYSVEYGTTISQNGATIVAPTVNVEV